MPKNNQMTSDCNGNIWQVFYLIIATTILQTKFYSISISFAAILFTVFYLGKIRCMALTGLEELVVTKR